MRSGVLELLVLDQDKNQFPESNVNDRNFIIAEDGKEYEVQVRVYRDENGKFPSERFRIGLYIDGYDVPYWKRVDLTESSPKDSDEYVTATFLGFKKNPSDLRSFKFSLPSLLSPNGNAEEKGDSKSVSQLGSIKTVLYKCSVVENSMFKNTGKFHEVPTSHCRFLNHRAESLVDIINKPSLVTKAGRAFDQNWDLYRPVKKWKRNSKSGPDLQIEAPYHTASVVKLIEKEAYSETGGNQAETKKRKR